MKILRQDNNTDLLVINSSLSFLLKSPELVWQASIEITKLFFFLFLFLRMHIRLILEPFPFQVYLCECDITEMKVLFKKFYCYKIYITLYVWACGCECE